MRVLVLFLLFFSSPVQAEEDCLASFLVVDRDEVWDFQHPEPLHFPLPSRRGDGTYLTPAAAHYEWKKDLDLAIHFDFHLPPGQVSYPYNVYKVSVEVGEEGDNDHFRYEHDFTQGCRETGASMMPGQQIQLPLVKIPPHSNGESRGKERVRIRVWGLHF